MELVDIKVGSIITVSYDNEDTVLGIVEHVKNSTTMVELRLRSQEINAEVKHFKIDLYIYMTEFDLLYMSQDERHVSGIAVKAGSESIMKHNFYYNHLRSHLSYLLLFVYLKT